MSELSRELTDKLRRDAASAASRFDALFRDNLDKLSESDRVQIEEAAQRVKDALDGNDIALIKSISERLNQVWQAASAGLEDPHARLPFP